MDVPQSVRTWNDVPPLFKDTMRYGHILEIRIDLFFILLYL